MTLAVLMASAVGLQALREKTGALAEGGDTVLYVRSPEALRRLALSYDSLLRGRLLDSRRAALRRHQAVDGGPDNLRPAVSAARPDDVARPAVRPSPTTSVALFLAGAAARRTGPPGPGHRAAREGLQGQAGQLGVHAGDRVRALLVVRGLSQGRAEWFQRASEMPGAPVWMQPLAAVTLAEGGSREGSRLLWQQIAKGAEDDWFRAEAARRLAQLDASTSLTSSRQLAGAYEAGSGTPPAGWAALVRGGYAARRSGGPARRAVRHRRERRSSLDPKSPPVCRCRSRGRAVQMIDLPRSSSRSSSGSIVGSFLNVCIYRLPRAAVDRCGRRRAAPVPARELRWCENVPGSELGRGCAGRCRTCGQRISAMYPIVEAGDRRAVRRRAVLCGATPLGVRGMLFGCAMIVLFVIDLAAPHPAQRHHRAGRRRRPRAQPGAASGLARRR